MKLARAEPGCCCCSAALLLMSALAAGLLPAALPAGTELTPSPNSGGGSAVGVLVLLCSGALALPPNRGLKITLSGERGVRGLATTLPASSAAAGPCEGGGTTGDAVMLLLLLLLGGAQDAVLLLPAAASIAAATL
jgi:hypothetical protein